MSDSREQMVLTAARLFQRDGYHATTWRGLVAEGGAPWGSINHHFPGGKEQLAVEAVELGAAAVDALIDHCFAEHTDPSDAIAAWFSASAGLAVSSDFTAGCPVATVALEMNSSPGALRDATERAFTRWQKTLARHLRRAGASQPAETALTVIALLEGALILARTHRSRRPMTVAGDRARRLVDV